MNTTLAHQLLEQRDHRGETISKKKTIDLYKNIDLCILSQGVTVWINFTARVLYANPYMCIYSCNSGGGDSEGARFE